MSPIVTFSCISQWGLFQAKKVFLSVFTNGGFAQVLVASIRVPT